MSRLGTQKACILNLDAVHAGISPKAPTPIIFFRGRNSD